MTKIVEIGRGVYNSYTGLLISVNDSLLFLFDNSDIGWTLDTYESIVKRFPQYKTAWWVDREETNLTNEIGEIK